MELNKHSKHLTQSDSQPASQAMLYALGLSEADLAKPFVGIASTGFDGNPCNMHLNKLAYDIKESTNNADLVGLVFNTIGVSDGISMGTEGMRYSLPSREIIADSIETMVEAHGYDAIVTVVGCDKNMPGALMAMNRLNRPSIMLYGGTIRSGCYNGEKLNIVSAFEAWGKKVSGQISKEDYENIIKNACPGPGACGGMYTANTMASAIEAMGMSLPFSSSNPAESKEKQNECLEIGKAIKILLEKNIRPSDIITKKSLENAFTLVTILGGSTNAVLHFIAIAKSAKVDFTFNDFQRITDKTPFLADLKPSGKYLMEDVHQAGGTPAVMRYLLENNFLHGDCLTVTGKTISENLQNVSSLNPTQKVIVPIQNPLKKTGHIQILFGNLAEQGSVAKITGKEGLKFVGSAKVFNGEFEANEGIEKRLVNKGDVVVIRYEGPKGAPGMPEMLKPTSAIMGAGLGNDIALITDGRFSGGTHGFVVGHITPEAQLGGLIALVEDGDIISIDAEKRLLSLEVDEGEIQRRRSLWKAPELKSKSGWLKKYTQLVSSASEGCVTDEFDK
ncbi:MAG: dihydroxy-acid dehydratase [Ignavibacteriota bacterium]